MSLSRGRPLALFLGSALVVAAFVLAAALYGRLPDPVPTHWNLRGEVNGTTAKPLGAFLLPLTMLAVHVAMLFLGSTSERVRGILHLSILGFLFVCTAVALLAATGAPVPVSRILPAATGVLLAVIGNYLGKLRKNFFIGIRTPWTLRSDEVWLRTHRLGGKVFVVGGLALTVATLAGAGPAAEFVIIGALVLVPTVYSYVIYHRITAA